MKKLICVLVLIFVVVAYAQSVSITITIPVDKVQDFVTGYLAKRPIPIDRDSESDTYGQPLYTAKQHIKRETIKDMFRVYRHGKMLLKQQEAVIDPNVIEYDEIE